MSESRLPFDDDEEVRLKADPTNHVRGVRLQPDADPVDAAARRHAVDPAQNVVLEASAGTGKTRVLVERYVNLLRAGVAPDHILAITFTRKAAAEMRQRIIERLKEASRLSEFDAARWRDLKDGRLDDIAISTIDAFCLSLLREFPLEADVDPGFELADSTEVPRLIAESLDQALRICRGVARDDEDVALVFAQLGERRLRAGIAALLDRRLVAPHALRRFLQKGPRNLTAASACEASAARLRDIFNSVRGGLDAFLQDGPHRHPQFAMLAADIRRLAALKGRATKDEDRLAALKGCATSDDGGATTDVARGFSPAELRNFIDRLRAYFLTQEGKPRGERFAGTPFKAADCNTDDAWKRHRAAASQIAPPIAEAIRAFRRDLNAVMSRGVWRIFAVALRQYQSTLDAHALLDFSGVLERAIQLLKDLDEFAESRLRLEARYRHVLVDEFQDTSRAQWELVLQLVRSWGEGFGASDDAIPPSIFIVGDRKQSIYGFRDADVAVVDEAAQFVEGLRPEGQPRRAITVSFRAMPELLAFVNDVFAQIVEESGAGARRDAFRYGDTDRFPIHGEVRLKADATARGQDEPTRGVRLQPDRDDPVQFIAGETVRAAADKVGDEIARLLAGTTIRDRATGVARAARAADAAILFRSRDSHREFESALERRGVPTYVYKGLGFFDADEIQDAVALLRYLADPLSNLRADTLLRSRIVRLSDTAIAQLGSSPADAILRTDATLALAPLGDEDRRVLDRLRAAVPRWLSWVDRLAPSALLDAIVRETAYAYELRGPRRRQARENLKKLRGMIRRAQNRGYATLARIADHLDRLAVGDESNAAIDAIDAVSLMTVHAAKGLEFPIVFVVNMGRGTGGARAPIRVVDEAAGDASVAIADYQSEADEDAAAREREETKRLLYVALTRARDRLYLSATVQDGTVRMGRGSLGEVLPASIRTRFVAASTLSPQPSALGKDS
ncbi:MAG: UvrD-helicase domain-containing protein [Acidobacteriia bacterium]|nr:UvrD-helicase domain-containing protein [Terriglobia bacterium]